MVDSPKGPDRLRGGPGWYSHSPAMALLATRLQGMENSRIFNGLRAMIQPAARFANAILARMTAREPVHPRWQGLLRLDRQAKIGRQPRQPIFRRLAERFSANGERQRALRTLSLPDSLLEALAPSPSLAEDDPYLYEDGGSWTDAHTPLEFSAANPPPGSSETAQPWTSPTQTSRQTVHPLKSAPSVKISAQARAGASQQAAAWPFLLVQPRRTAQAETAWMRAANLLEAAPSRTNATSSQRAALTSAPASGQPGREQARHSLAATVRATRGTPSAALQARPMTVQQAHMPVTTVRFPAALAENVPSSAAQPEYAAQPGLTHPGFEASRARSEAVKFTGPDSEMRAVTPANPAIVRSKASSPRTTLGGLALLRTPAAMLGLAAPQPTEFSAPEASAVKTMSASSAETVQTAAQASQPVAAQSVEREWPLFGVLRQLESRPQTGESSALQHLRRMWPQSQLGPAVSAAFSASAALGPGEPLSPQLRGSMEAQLGRPLGEVRLHASPIAQMLRAEAFTSGQHVVFAPGRLDPRTPTGLVLLGHELSHVGQSLAFKAESGAGSLTEDSSEQAAHQQEDQIRSVIAQGWPEPAGRAYRRAPQAQTPAGSSSSAISVQRAVEINEIETAPAQQDGASPQNGQNAPAPSAGQNPGGAATASPAANIDGLARQVYSILKERLRAERTRHELYGR